MTSIPAVPGQDIAAKDAKLFALDNQNPNRKVEVANYYLEQNNDFWIKKAQMQTKFTENQQVFRSFYYFNKKQLTLPPEQVWQFNLSKSYRTEIGDHDYIALDVDFYSVLVTDAKTIYRSEPVLNIIGGKWSNHWILPVDPEFLLQRTGYACVDRKSLTIDSENIWAYYNDSCKDKLPQVNCCADALNQNVGSVNAYRYNEQSSCVIHEQRIGAPEWRRLLRFTTTSLNSDKTDVHLGNVTDPVYLYHGVFEWTRRKVGFCLQSSWRYFNTEYTSLNSLYDTCAYQGISAGWGDDYVAGLDCQWIDITGLPAQTAPLSYVLNPDELTNFTTSYGYSVSREKCNFITNWKSNNYESINYTLHNNLSFVTEPCTRSQSGPLRDW
ncbi:25148_t:CDS:2 [Gigaspora margarita]|uniref:25148_t:CDS:1 n=1 Tax=Gigaspora margarita TaxID=4874 RepID=A0ABN7UI38_GIGMA|nr:25148_t:CDS:2 [Gigaspora margarita]